MKNILLRVLFCLILSGMTPAFASKAGDVEHGNRLYEKGKYSQAIEKYLKALKKDPESDIINYDLGTAYYKNNDHQKAVEHLQKSLLGERTQLKNNAHYNLGNALFKFGLSKEQENLELAVETLEKSLVQYEESLNIRANDQDATHNHKVAKIELERLKEKLKKSKSQQCQRPQNKDNKDKEQPDQGEKQQPDQQARQPDQQQQRQQPEQAQQQHDRQPDREQQQQEQSDRQEPDKENSDRGEDNQDGQTTAKPQTMFGKEEMTKEEALRLLDKYQQTEEPKDLLNLLPKKTTEEPVLKDW